jgi:excisionase family DNA binding protein
MADQDQIEPEHVVERQPNMDRLYTIDQIAKLGGPRRAKLYLDIKQGRLKTMKFGRSTRISESAWKDYLQLAARY